jgi:hypothetical protein
MDLTKEYPRSVHDKVLGVVQLGRTIDKGKATARGDVGEYHYDCPMDNAVFGFLGFDAGQLLEAIKNATSDADIEAFLRPFVAKKSSAEIETWNHEWLNRKPQGEGLEFFTNLRNQIAPDRTDVNTWADLLDLDEKRPVPQRAAA